MSRVHLDSRLLANFLSFFSWERFVGVLLITSVINNLPIWMRVQKNLNNVVIKKM